MPDGLSLDQAASRRGPPDPAAPGAAGAQRARPHGAVLQPYRGYGSKSRIFVIGRAFWQRTDKAGRRAEIGAIPAGIRRRPVRGARILARFYGAELMSRPTATAISASRWGRAASCPGDRVWHRLELPSMSPALSRPTSEVYIPPATARLVVVSDIDDTVMDTGVANKAAMLWRLFVKDADSRTVFPGVVALYRASTPARRGRRVTRCSTSHGRRGGFTRSWRRSSGSARSRSGPILFLREWGAQLEDAAAAAGDRPQAAPDRGDDGPLRRLPFVLIGDSGQRDPEIYRRIVDRYGARVARSISATWPPGGRARRRGGGDVRGDAGGGGASGAGRGQRGDRRGRLPAGADLRRGAGGGAGGGWRSDGRRKRPYRRDEGCEGGAPSSGARAPLTPRRRAAILSGDEPRGDAC